MKKVKKVSRLAKRRLIILVPVTLLVVGYFLISLGYYTYKIYNLKVEEKKLEQQLNDLEEDEDNLKTSIEKFQNPDYLARYARENYHYSKDGELVIQRDKVQEVQEELEEVENQNERLMIVCVVGLVVVAAYIIIRNKKSK